MYHRVALRFISNSFIRRSLCLALASLTAFSGSLVTIGHLRERRSGIFRRGPIGQVLNRSYPQEPTALELGMPIERELAGGQKHSYQINLNEGQYANVMVEHGDWTSPSDYLAPMEINRRG